MFQSKHDQILEMITVIDMTILKYGHCFEKQDLDRFELVKEGLEKYAEDYPDPISKDSLEAIEVLARLALMLWEVFH